MHQRDQHYIDLRPHYIDYRPAVIRPIEKMDTRDTFLSGSWMHCMILILKPAIFLSGSGLDDLELNPPIQYVNVIMPPSPLQYCPYLQSPAIVDQRVLYWLDL
jgi:hypothetical protein